MTTRAEIPITPRQLELLALFASGYDMQEIGAAKHLSPHTVRNILYAARDNAEANNVVHLAAMCVETGQLVRNGKGYKPLPDERVVGE